MEPVRVQFQYTKEEYVRAVRFYLRKSGTTPLWDIAVFAGILALVFMMIYLTGITPMTVALLVLLAVVSGLGAVVYLFMPGYQYDHTPQILEQRTLYFTVDDIGIQTASSAGIVKWTFTKFWCSKTDYYLIQNRQVYTLLPKRIFADDAERYRFEQIVMAANPNIRRRNF